MKTRSSILLAQEALQICKLQVYVIFFSVLCLANTFVFISWKAFSPREQSFLGESSHLAAQGYLL